MSWCSPSRGGAVSRHVRSSGMIVRFWVSSISPYWRAISPGMSASLLSALQVSTERYTRRAETLLAICGMLTAVPTTVWLFGSRFPRRDSEIFVLRSSSDLLDSVEHLRRRLMTSLRRFSDPSYSALVNDLGGL